MGGEKSFIHISRVKILGLKPRRAGGTIGFFAVGSAEANATGTVGAAWQIKGRALEANEEKKYLDPVGKAKKTRERDRTYLSQ